MESDGEQSLISFSGTCTWGHWGWVVRNPINNEPALASFPPTISYLTGKQHRQVNHAHESGAAPLCLSCPMHAWFMNLLCSCLICNVISLIRFTAWCRRGHRIYFFFFISVLEHASTTVTIFRAKVDFRRRAACPPPFQCLRKSRFTEADTCPPLLIN
jgi:hypothetical protein